MSKRISGELSKFNGKITYRNMEQCDKCKNINELYIYNLVIKHLMKNKNNSDILNNTFIINRNNVLDFKSYFKNYQYWLIKKIMTKKNEALLITNKFNDIIELLKSNGEDMYLLQKYKTDTLLFDSKLIYYRFYFVTVMRTDNSKEYSIFFKNNILLSKKNYTIDNWKDLCFQYIYPTDFTYYFGHENWINTIKPRAHKLINSISDIILDLLNDKTIIDWNYFHVFTIDISFTQNMDAKLENISELARDKLYNECSDKNNGEKVFFESLNNYINDIVFKQRKLEHFTEKHNDTIDGFKTNNNIIEGFKIDNDTIEEFDSIQSDKFQLFTKTSKYKNYKLFFIILFIIIINFIFYKIIKNKK
tara:strand:+ start:3469 stop:4551 length:1083 start_codon:yes stop_codon:yes gene_type:complete